MDVDVESSSSESESTGHSDWEEIGPQQNVPNYLDDDYGIDVGALGIGDIPIQNSTTGPGSGAGIPETGLQIFVPDPNRLQPKGKKAKNFENVFVYEVNKTKREMYRVLHRCSLLCNLALGMKINSIINKEEILCLARDSLPSSRSVPPKNLSLAYLERLLDWFTKTFEVLESHPDYPLPNLEPQIKPGFVTKQATDANVLVLMFIAILRALGAQARMIINLNSLPLRPDKKDLLKLNKREEDKSKDESSYDGSSSDDSEPSIPDDKKQKSKKTIALSKLKKKLTAKSPSESSYSSESEDEEPKPKTKRKKPRKDTGKLKKQNINSKKPKIDFLQSVVSAEEDSLTNLDGDELVRIANSGRKFISSSDEEYFEESRMEAEILPKKPQKYDFWPEVYLEEEERWVSVDVTERKIMADTNLRVKATQPVWYVIAYNNSGHIKDVSKRYAAQWFTSEMRERDNDWFMKTIRPFTGRRTRIDKEEDKFLNEHIKTVPIPKSYSLLKNHPLFACKKQLKKFEAIYPEDTIPVGYIKNEPVYPRAAVHVLAGREFWFRKARVVRVGEEPYKVVKGRPKYDKVKRSVDRNVPELELFGEWQTEEYIPPVAINGKVPRSEYGNVQLFLPKMLPIGTVHLQLPGLNRVARKLDIDCAPALVGFEYTTGGCYPKYEGFVICEEFKEILLDVWNAEQDESFKKAEDKRRTRVRGNWRRLIRGVIIRKRYEKKYNLDLSGSTAGEGGGKGIKSKTSKKK